MGRFSEENDPDEPAEGDLVTSDRIHFYEQGSSKRKPVITVFEGYPNNSASDRKIWANIKSWMAANSYFPNVWFISDHGNAHLMSPPARVQKQSLEDLER